MIDDLPNLGGLIESNSFKKGRFKEFTKSLLRQLVFESSCDRAILWLYQPSRKNLRNYTVYSGVDDAYYGNDVLFERDHEFFFDLLRNNVVTTIGSISSWENLKALSEQYARPYNISSMLGVQVWNKGNLFGFLFLESVKQLHNWRSKDQVLLNSASFLISQAYDNSILRREQKFLEENTPDFDSIFNDIPIPILLFDPKDLSVFGFNDSIAKVCGYEAEEFQGLKLRDLIAETSLLKFQMENSQGATEVLNNDLWDFKHKSGQLIQAQIKSSQTDYCGQDARLLVVFTVKKEQSSSKQEQLEQRLADHAFYTSHYVRGPIANILGLIDLIKLSWEDRENYEDLIYRLKIQIMNLDEAVRVMSAKVELD